MKKSVSLLLVVTLLIVLLSGCAKSESKENEEDISSDIKIGVQLPLTGATATDGLAIKKAYELGFEQINAEGGINGRKILPIYVDDGSDPQMAATAANKLIAEGVVLVTGTFASGAALPAMSLYNDAKIPFFIGNANSNKLVEENPGNMFLCPYTSRHQVIKGLEVANKLGVKKVAIVDQGDAYSGDLADDAEIVFQENGLEIVTRQIMNKGEQDTSALVTTIKAAKPDMVFWTAYYADGALLTKSLRDGGYEGYILTGDGSSGAQYIELGGEATEGAIVLSPPIAQELPSAGQFVNDFKEKYGTEPSAYEPSAYHALQIVHDVLKRTKSLSFEDIIEAGEATNVDTILGHVQFLENRSISQSLVMATIVKNGKYVAFDFD
jgi:branched-chain amino acid transport system substrate-binding protein